MNNNDTYSYILWRGTNFIDEKGGKKPPQCLKSFLSTAYVWFWVKMELPLWVNHSAYIHYHVIADLGHCN